MSRYEVKFEMFVKRVETMNEMLMNETGMKTMQEEWHNETKKLHTSGW